MNFGGNDELSPSTQDVRLPPRKLLPLLRNEDDTIRADGYEWYLYLQMPWQLNGQLTLPNITKYRSLDTDLVSRDRWSDEKNELLDKSQLHKLTDDPQQAITDMNSKLNNRLQHVSDYLEQSDNSNIILRNTKGKCAWRLPSTTKKHLVNNPFFQQMPTQVLQMGVAWLVTIRNSLAVSSMCWGYNQKVVRTNMICLQF